MFLRNMQGWKDSEPLEDQLDLVCEEWGDEGEMAGSDVSLVSGNNVIKERKEIKPKGQD